MITFLHTTAPTPIAFQLGSLTVHWYGVTMVLGMLAGIFVLQVLAKKINISKDDVYDLAFYLVIASLLGARIYAVFLELPYYLQNPDQIIAVWNGGLAIHGGIIGGLLALVWHCKKKKYNFTILADALVPALALGQAIGRWGNYFNQELFGKPTQAPWGIPISLGNRPPGYQSFEYFHPTFLYESILNICNFIVLYIVFKKIYVAKKLKPGTAVFIYLITYGIIRILMEQIRIDTTALISGIRVPVIASSILIIVGSMLLIKKYSNTQQ